MKILYDNFMIIFFRYYDITVFIEQIRFQKLLPNHNGDQDSRANVTYRIGSINRSI